MSNVLERNLSVLQSTYPNLYTAVTGHSVDTNSVEVVNSHSNEVTIKVLKADGSISYLHSRYNPIEEAERWCDSLESNISDSDDLFVYGMGLGYHIEELMKRYPHKRFYIYEPEPAIFIRAIESRNLEGILLHPNLIVLGVGREEFIQEQMITSVIDVITSSYKIVSLNGYERIYSDEMRVFNRLCKKEINRYRSNLATYAVFGEDWVKNITLNMPKNISSHSVKKLKDVLKQQPVLIVGSGPSADLDKEALQQLSSRVFTIAAGSSVQFLFSIGIIPDLIVTLDGSEKNYQVFSGLQYSDIPLLYGTYVHHKIIENKRKALFHVAIAEDTLTEYLLNEQDAPTFASACSVTGTAIQAAVYMGASSIIFAGQDFSYPNNRLYANKVDHFTDEEITDYLEAVTELEVPNVCGSTNPTSIPMMVTLESIEELISFFNSKIEFINTSKVGAHIKGTKHTPIEYLLDEHPEWNKSDGSLFNTASHESSCVENGKMALEKMQDLLEQLGKSNSTLERINEYCRQILSTDKTMDSFDNYVSFIEQKWSEIVNKPVFTYIYSAILHHQLVIFRRYIPKIVSEKDESKRGRLLVKHLLPVTSNMQEVTPRLIEYFREGINKVEKCIEEHSREVK
ncbi:MAG: 6-hydroxymethylpterin diphosphokinase MptE-like protein [Paenibacillus dendritiformis]|uniref:motility associated factor glycosyltransferase family protein n=1 Tax=uncultured Paenibacillus sp. TaxID=227322 RepID=UPI0025D55D87|nr:6-hydroxymethylpterin diphosphokinase MptE-like protein [uncultured Paenibacillus sp.]MDU5141544.1 6-hydroxymethylpterin diphosphokinase MptE-like protein [Paenibacillus dendritiformis]